MKNYDYEIAIILKKVQYENSMIGYLPEKIVDGFFDEESNCFFDFEGTPYYHIIHNPDNYGFCKRMNMKSLKDSSPILHPNIIKSKIFKKFKKFYYLSEVDADYNVPIISFGNKKQESKILLDYDILKYYYDYHKMFYDFIIDEYQIENIFKNEEIKEKFDINKTYEKITSKIIGQNDPIKKIVTIIFQHFNNFNIDLSNNILINGDVGVGKKEIFNSICSLNNIPCVKVSLYENISLEILDVKICNALEELAKKSNYNIEKAGRGVLILDGIEKILNDEFLQSSLVNILDEGGSLKLGNTEYEMDFNKMLIVGIGNFNKKESLGFDSNVNNKFTKDDLIKCGMNNSLVDKFSYLIEMNSLDIEDFKNILNSDTGYLNIIKSLLTKQGIVLNISDETIESIAKECIRLKKGVKGIEEVINNIMLNINYEIASKPDIYSEVIINQDTIIDNNNYKLLKKSLHKE